MLSPRAVFTGISKSYDGQPSVQVLTDFHLTMFPGETISIVGPSGSGKSTALNIIGLLDRPTSGSATVMGVNTEDASSRTIDRIRAQHLGFVFQDSHVLPVRTCFDNVHLSLWASQTPRPARAQLVETAIEKVGLSHRLHQPARVLSGGERQRLAIARAIVRNPSIILADEPTGNLDPDNSQRIVDLLNTERDRGAAVVIITHDHQLAEQCDRTFTLADGVLEPVSAHA